MAFENQIAKLSQATAHEERDPIVRAAAEAYVPGASTGGLDAAAGKARQDEMRRLEMMLDPERFMIVPPIERK